LALTPNVEPVASNESAGTEQIAALPEIGTVSPPVQVMADPREGEIVKTTVPVPPDVTFAVKDTAWPETDGFCEDVTVVVLGLFVYVYVLPDPVGASLVTVTVRAPRPPAAIPFGVYSVIEIGLFTV
jgi:hypothetical protein